MPWATSNRLERLPDDWPVIQDAVLKDADWKCQIKDEGCLGVGTEADHIIPGDDHSRSNLQAACKSCHGRKSAREGNNARARLRRLSKRPRPKHPGSAGGGYKSPW